MQLCQIIETAFKHNNDLVDRLIKDKLTESYPLKEWTIQSFTHCIMDMFDCGRFDEEFIESIIDSNHMHQLDQLNLKISNMKTSTVDPST